LFRFDTPCRILVFTWTAHFERERAPVRRFAGRDESKAVRAAKRAAELADQQRELALQRAGLRPASRKVRTGRSPRFARL
jgi:hypothetical protein